MPEQSAFMCPRCQIGLCRPERITYVRMYAGMLLRVPDMLVYTCDICGYQELEQDAFYQLQAVIGEADPSIEDAKSVAKPSPLDTIDSQDSNTTRRPKH